MVAGLMVSPYLLEDSRMCSGLERQFSNLNIYVVSTNPRRKVRKRWLGEYINSVKEFSG